MKSLSLLFIPVILSLFIQSSNTTLATLKKRKVSIDQYEYKHRKEMVVLVKLTGKKKLVKVKNEDWPDDTEYIYNILKDSTGRVILTEQIPYSQSGDWYVEWKHYFDSNGNTFLFSKRETLFDESVKGGMAVEESLKYYDSNCKIIDQSFRLTDKDDKTIKGNVNNFNFRNDKYSIYKNLNDCLKAYDIKP